MVFECRELFLEALLTSLDFPGKLGEVLILRFGIRL
jgi:hypothetical protein